ncbi:NAD(+)/NADH kinase [Tepidiforma sp.]|uniref:NAD(+)/NADH kinase n=1 Tax=Tepidiforma sp. TaxID=2682230 RepID=UPI002ADE14EF|nr:NAD(+)/NADH kinase [Tepidiforma sp.]
MPTGIIGIIANPASGKDIRRLVAHAPVVTDAEKRAILRRFLVGAARGGARAIHYLPGPHRLVEEALAGLDLPLEAVPLPVDLTGSALDTRAAAALLREREAAVVLVLGGDGTCRAAAAGWLDLPILPLSTGTNNVFPRVHEPTLAGLAAGLLAAGRLPLEHAVVPAPYVAVEIDGEPPDLALVDVALVDEPFPGARAVRDPASLRRLLVLRSDPAVTGLAAIPGAMGLALGSDAALELEFGRPGIEVLAPLAPGRFETVCVSSSRLVPLGQDPAWSGPGILALDGERERRLLPGQQARPVPLPGGPLVIDPRRVLTCAARAGLFRIPPNGAPDAD